jgi:hypothetical protein
MAKPIAATGKAKGRAAATATRSIKSSKMSKPASKSAAASTKIKAAKTIPPKATKASFVPIRSKTATKAAAAATRTDRSDRGQAITKFFSRRKTPATYAVISKAIGVETSGTQRDSISSSLRTLVRKGYLVRVEKGTYQRAIAQQATTETQAAA